jgi:uncharacterized damage-inducible protein DinB/putative sterol carrier protein
LDFSSRAHGDRKEAFAISLIQMTLSREGELAITRIRRKNMDSALERIFCYKAYANNEILAAMRQFEDASPAKEIAVRILNHTYAVDRIFAANLTGTAHGYTSPNPMKAPSIEQLSAAIKTSDQWYINYVSLLDETQLAERIDFTFTDGLPGRMSREEMLMHLTVHGEYHRGQISLMMMENSATPPADGFTTFLHKTEASSRRRAGGSSETVESHSDENRLNMARLAKQAPTDTSAKDGKSTSRLDELTESLRAAVGADSGLGRTLKFDLKGEGFIYIDGPSVTNEDKRAVLTLILSIDDLKAISQGKLAPMAAMMSGRLKLSDMGVAANLQGKIQALFSRMRSASS